MSTRSKRSSTKLSPTRSTSRARKVFARIFPAHFCAQRTSRCVSAAAAKGSGEAAEIKAEIGLIQSADGADQQIAKDEKLEELDSAVEAEIEDAQVSGCLLLAACVLPLASCCLGARAAFFCGRWPALRFVFACFSRHCRFRKSWRTPQNTSAQCPPPPPPATRPVSTTAPVSCAVSTMAAFGCMLQRCVCCSPCELLCACEMQIVAPRKELGVKHWT